MRNITIFFLMIICIGFAQDDKKVNQGRQGRSPKNYRMAPRQQSGANFERMLNSEITKVKYIWNEDKSGFKLVCEYDKTHKLRKTDPADWTCEEMLAITWIEPDSILHTCPEHTEVMIYKCQKCEATTLEREHICTKE